jgi:hypothetical protein
VKTLAHQVMDNVPNTYDRAEALESFLRSPPFSYSPQVKPTPPGKDPVDYFLFDLKQDFCEYFASAMVVMLREEGIPARLVEGFTTGTFDSTSNAWVVKEQDAHAWVEAYFPGYGWIEFEPTPSQPPFPRQDASLSTGSDSGDGTAAGDTSGDPNDPNRPNRAEDDLNQGDGGGAFSGDTVVAAVRAIDPRPALVLIGLLLLLLAFAVARFNWRFRRYGPIESAWGKTRLLASYVGYPAHPSQTTYEFASSLGAAIPETHDPVQSLARARVLEQYSANGADEDLRDAAETAWHQVASAMLTLLPGRVLRFFTHLWR